MNFNQNILLVLLGPTAVGKTDLSIKLAKHYGTPVISADSRQIYQGLEIGTAAPSKSLLNEIKHHFIGTLNVSDYYSASEYESDVISLTSDLFKRHHVLLLTGGSMMYIDAVCKGIDDIPNIDENLRKDLYEIYKKEGLDPIRQQLKILDPVIYGQVDLKNYKRVIHALEVCLMTGKPYSSFRSNKPKSRPFKIVKVGLTRNRDELYNRINQRVDNMIAAGLIDEAKRFYPYKNLNSLNTVGYKEIFKFFDNEWGLDTAIEKIKRNTRVYARKQLTWFKRDPEIRWFNLSVENETDVRQKIIELTDSEDQPENRHTLF